MPTPLGHALVGLTIGWSAEAIRRTPRQFGARSALATACAALAVCPDLDMLYFPIHRTITHSIVAPVAVAAIGAVVLRRARHEAVWPTALVCAVAYASHLLLDWLGGDTKIPRGIQLLWPFSAEWYISNWEVFRPTHLGSFFTAPIIVSNSLAVMRELLLLGPIALLALRWRHRSVTAYTRRAAPHDRGAQNLVITSEVD